jgi:hypothetical protein
MRRFAFVTFATFCYVELARSVYRNNDRRAALKREINELLGSGKRGGEVVRRLSVVGC